MDHIPTLELLIKNGADPNEPNVVGHTIFTLIDESGRWKNRAFKKRFIKFMQKHKGIKTHLPQKNSKACQYILNKNYTKIEPLRKHEFEKVTCRSKLGYPVTPLHIAVIENDEKALKILFQKKVNLNVKDYYGDTSLI